MAAGIGFFAGALALVVIAIVVLARRLATARSAMAATRRSSEKLRIRADAAERAAAVAQDNHAGSMRLAADAVAQSGQALSVAQEIHAVAGQVNTLLGLVLGEPVEVSAHGRHAMRVADQPAIADGAAGGWTE